MDLLVRLRKHDIHISIGKAEKQIDMGIVADSVKDYLTGQVNALVII